MRKILLTLMLLVAATATMSAQDEQTAEPQIVLEPLAEEMSYHPDDYTLDRFIHMFYCVDIENADDCEVVIYYRIIRSGLATEWQEYDMTKIYFWDSGSYGIEAYAQADGKLPSNICSSRFDVNDYYLYSVFIIDGVYFKTIDNSSAMVTSAAEWSDDFGYYGYNYTGDIVIPSQVELYNDQYAVNSIDDYAFRDCNVRTVVLPNTIETIGCEAFSGCIGLKSVVVQAVTPPTTYVSFDYYDDSLFEQITLFVPAESIEAYRAHEEWGKFTHIVPFLGAGPGDINGDGNIAISDATNLIDQLLSGDELPAYADVNGDGVVTIKDVTDLIDMLLNGN